MTEDRRRIATAILVLTLGAFASATAARGQDIGMGGGRSLGGYGAAGLSAAYGDPQGVLIPYGGGTGGYIPSSVLEPSRSSAILAPRPIPVTPIGGRSAMGTPIGGASRMRPAGVLYTPLNISGGMGAGGAPGMSGRAGSRRSLGFGYPFRQPPSPGGRGGGAAMGAM